MTISRFVEFFFRSIPATFASDFPGPEAISRLRNATKRSAFSALFTEGAVGPVSEKRVRLQRVVPFVHNSFKPIFVGSFVERAGRTILEGHFTLSRFTKIFMTLWFSFILIWTIAAVVGVISLIGTVREHPEMVLMPFGGVAFFLIGIAGLRFGWRISRRDIDYLSTVISRAFTRTPA